MAIPALPGVSGSDKTPPDFANGVIEGVLEAPGPSKAFSIWGPMNLVVYGVLANALTTTAGSDAGSVASATLTAQGDAINSVNVPPGTTIGGLVGTTVTFAFAPQTWSGYIRAGSDVISNIAQPEDLSTLDAAEVVSPYFAAGATVIGYDNEARTLQISSAATSAPNKNAMAQIEFKPTGNCITVTGADADATLTGAAINFNADLQIERSFDGGRTWIVCNVGGSGMLAQYTANTPISISFGDPEAGMLYRINATDITPVANVSIRYRLSTTGQASTVLSVPALS